MRARLRSAGSARVWRRVDLACASAAAPVSEPDRAPRFPPLGPLERSPPDSCARPSGVFTVALRQLHKQFLHLSGCDLGEQLRPQCRLDLGHQVLKFVCCGWAPGTQRTALRHVLLPDKIRKRPFRLRLLAEDSSRALGSGPTSTARRLSLGGLLWSYC